MFLYDNRKPKLLHFLIQFCQHEMNTRLGGVNILVDNQTVNCELEAVIGVNAYEMSFSEYYASLYSLGFTFLLNSAIWFTILISAENPEYPFILASGLTTPETDVLVPTGKLVFSWSVNEEYYDFDNVVTFTPSVKQYPSFSIFPLFVSPFFSHADRIFPHLRIAGAEKFIALQTLDAYASAGDLIIEAAPANGVEVTHHFMINNTNLFETPTPESYSNVTETVKLLKEIPNIEDEYVIFFGLNWVLQVQMMPFLSSHLSLFSRCIYWKNYKHNRWTWREFFFGPLLYISLKGIPPNWRILSQPSISMKHLRMRQRKNSFLQHQILEPTWKLKKRTKHIQDTRILTNLQWWYLRWHTCSHMASILPNLSIP